MQDTRLPKKLLFGELKSGKRNQGGQKKRFKDTLKASFRGLTLMWITEERDPVGASLWMVLLHLSQIESRRPRIKDNFASPESTICVLVGQLSTSIVHTMFKTVRLCTEFNKCINNIFLICHMMWHFQDGRH